MISPVYLFVLRRFLIISGSERCDTHKFWYELIKCKLLYSYVLNAIILFVLYQNMAILSRPRQYRQLLFSKILVVFCGKEWVVVHNINFRKKGIASLSIKLLEKYCFNLINLHQIYCFISEENKTSINLFLTNKFEVCGKINDWVLTGNKWQNALLLQKINKS